ncbi:hypothetical protein Dsin_000406 [Dipteronia sinensis]|uniref:Uncharacterized protein n=1 Tax=Dipteronia sinensis TaxID=43782 RepID=A0AAE0B3B5_9ROSI|nr:hypothetical protein Dsin_000406 [Dipteronia sinensis]
MPFYGQTWHTSLPSFRVVPKLARLATRLFQLAGPTGTGQDRTGQDWTGLDLTGQDWTGLDRTGQDRTGLDWTGLDRTGLDWTGQDRTGLDWTGLDWTGQLFHDVFGMYGTRLWTVLLYVWYGWDRKGQEIQMTRVPSLFCLILNNIY